MPSDVDEAQADGYHCRSLWLCCRKSAAYYTYQGSLTTPPCSEIVRWLLLDTPVELSAEQIDVFAVIYSDIARPVQPLGKRDLLQDSP